MTLSARYGFQLAIALVMFTGSRCLAADNPLIGTWTQDWHTTLHELHLPTEGSKQLLSDATRAKRFVEGAVKNLGYNMTLTFTDEECTQVIFANNGTVLSKGSFPYRIVGVGKDYVIIDQLKNGGAGKLFLTANSFYIEVQVGEFTYKDYFRRLDGESESRL